MSCHKIRVIISNIKKKIRWWKKVLRGRGNINAFINVKGGVVSIGLPKRVESGSLVKDSMVVRNWF